jgi:hypothetical protein
MHGAIPRLPQYVFMAWCVSKHLVKHRESFTEKNEVNNLLGYYITMDFLIYAGQFVLWDISVV